MSESVMDDLVRSTVFPSSLNSY